MRKAEKVGDYIINLEIFVEELTKVSKDNFFVNSIRNAANRAIEDRKISGIKSLLSEFEKMCLELDMYTYKKIITRILRDGFIYPTVSSSIEKTVEGVIGAKCIKNMKQYRDVLFYVNINFENDGFHEIIDNLNRLLADYEKKHEDR